MGLSWRGKLTSSVLQWMMGSAADRQGSFQLETLMDSHIDKAFDKFTAWTLRNAFDFQKDLELVLVSFRYQCDGQADTQPWQNGMDFDRGEFVANLPKGEESVTEMIEELRAKVEQVGPQRSCSKRS